MGGESIPSQALPTLPLGSSAHGQQGGRFPGGQASHTSCQYLSLGRGSRSRSDGHLTPDPDGPGAPSGPAGLGVTRTGLRDCTARVNLWGKGLVTRGTDVMANVQGALTVWENRAQARDPHTRRRGAFTARPVNTWNGLTHMNRPGSADSTAGHVLPGASVAGHRRGHGKRSPQPAPADPAILTALWALLAQGRAFRAPKPASPGPAGTPARLPAETSRSLPAAGATRPRGVLTARHRGRPSHRGPRGEQAAGRPALGGTLGVTPGRTAPHTCTCSWPPALPRGAGLAAEGRGGRDAVTRTWWPCAVPGARG